jgi:polar amino acid transport system substrate-binding protein
MRGSTKINVLGLLVALVCSAAAGASPAPAPAALRVGYSSMYTMPLAQYDGQGALIGGLTLDISKAMAEQLQMLLRTVSLLRKRLEKGLLQGDLDLVCYLNPKWVEVPDAFLWMPALFRGETVLVTLLDVPRFNTLADFHGKTIGSVLGYFYPNLDEAVQAGRLKREDALDLDKSYRKLELKRVDAVVDNRIDFEYRLRYLPGGDKLNRNAVSVNQFEVGCAMSKKSALNPKAVEKATQALIKRGAPQKWLDKYR